MSPLLLVLLFACERTEKPGVTPADDTDAATDTTPPVVVDDTDDHGHVGVLPALCQEEVAPPPIAADLAAWADGVRLSDNPFYGVEPWEALEALGEDNLGATADEQVRNRLERGFQRLKFEQLDEAIADLQAALALAESSAPRWRGRARELLAITWMRKAELQNCVADGGGSACLVPFSEEAEHRLTEGMTEATSILIDFLTEDDGQKLSPRWLLNVAQMALGAYPDGVPEAWRVDPALLVSAVDLPAWTNVAPAVGPTDTEVAGGAALEDFNGDGLLDMLTSSLEIDVGMRLLLNAGDGTFCEASAASGVSAIPGVLDFFPADYDNDGDVDVLASRGAWFGSDGRVRPSLLRNDGEGRFVDVAREAGLAQQVGPAQAAAWADVDNDGWLDLFYGREADQTAPGGVAPSSLFLNQGDGTFVDIARDQPLHDVGFVKGCAFGDIDNDGDPDLYVNTRGGPNGLFQNDGAGRFTDITRGSGTAEPRNGFAAAFFDADQDGDLDLYAAGYDVLFGQRSVLDDSFGRSVDAYVADLLDLPDDTETMRLYRNDGGAMQDATAELGLDHVHLTMGMNVGDLDADGWPDLYFGTGAPAFEALEPNAAYRNAGGSRFDNVTFAVRMGHLQKGHGVAFGDVDDDGDEDLLSEIGGAYRSDGFPDALFENPSADVRSVTLRLEGVTSNRSAIGARVRVVTPERTFHHVVGTGGSFGANSLQVEAALGTAETIERVEIDWPGGETEVVEGVIVGTIVRIRQGEGVIAAWVRAPFGLMQPEMEHP